MEIIIKSITRRLKALSVLFALSTSNALAQDATDILQQARQVIGAHSLKVEGTVRHQKAIKPFSLEHRGGKSIIKTGNTSTSFGGQSTPVRVSES